MCEPILFKYHPTIYLVYEQQKFPTRRGYAERAHARSFIQVQARSGQSMRFRQEGSLG
jgi:hypothetical protein